MPLDQLIAGLSRLKQLESLRLDVEALLHYSVISEHVQVELQPFYHGEINTDAHHWYLCNHVKLSQLGTLASIQTLHLTDRVANLFRLSEYHDDDDSLDQEMICNFGTSHYQLLAHVFPDVKKIKVLSDYANDQRFKQEIGSKLESCFGDQISLKFIKWTTWSDVRKTYTNNDIVLNPWNLH